MGNKRGNLNGSSLGTPGGALDRSRHGFRGSEEVHGGGHDGGRLAIAEHRIRFADKLGTVRGFNLVFHQDCALGVGNTEVNQTQVGAGDGPQAGGIGQAFHGMDHAEPVLLQTQGMGLKMSMLKAQVMGAEVQPNGSHPKEGNHGHDHHSEGKPTGGQGRPSDDRDMANGMGPKWGVLAESHGAWVPFAEW
jgi:hypothetical protein